MAAIRSKNYKVFDLPSGKCKADMVFVREKQNTDENWQKVVLVLAHNKLSYLLLEYALKEY